MDKKPNRLTDLSDGQFNSAVSSSNEINILMDHLANEWIELAKKLPNPKPLFGNIWHQGEVAILFSNTGKGKSILAVQLADAITKGNPIITLDVYKQIAIYFDFELSTKAFQRRYSDEDENSYRFSDDFIRVEIDRNKHLESDEKSFEELIIESVKFQVEKSNAQVVIIDNITFLSATNEKSKEALSLMKLILDLSRKKSLAILLIAHTPKRDIFKPIQLEDLAGSKALSNFCDTVFCIGESVKGSKVRYIKQLKNRNYPIEFHENNVIECEVVKENSFLQFKFVGLNSEDEHLKKISEKSKDRIDEIIELKNRNLSNVEIAKQLGVSESAIRRRINKFHKRNQ
ncbi:AAA family ATPase [Chryseobacterium schmidteae]|uniref:AAA family ATPase n=1 Tax=Chryseobacterium schmidteae TaxID=2730404 RepID=UPI001588ACC1|nr:AAA family ATPase [Chryseobacterium schmidteae]